MDIEAPDWRSLTLKHGGDCQICGKNLASGTKALWSPSLHLVKCFSHKQSSEGTTLQTPFITNMVNFPNSEESINLGTPGGSAKAQAERRIEKRKERITNAFPRAGKFILAVTDDPQSTKAWETGARGEIGAGRKLEKLASKYHFKVLHDRLIPNSKANIDHIAITRSGVFVIDAKNYKGTIRVEDSSGIFSKPDPKLWVGRRNCMPLVYGVKKQLDVVKRILNSATIEMSVTGVLAFYQGDWEVFSQFMPQEEIQGVLINNRGIDEIVTRQGTHTPDEIDKVVRLLASKLIAAS